MFVCIFVFVTIYLSSSLCCGVAWRRQEKGDDLLVAPRQRDSLPKNTTGKVQKEKDHNGSKQTFENKNLGINTTREHREQV